MRYFYSHKPSHNEIIPKNHCCILNTDSIHFIRKSTQAGASMQRWAAGLSTRDLICTMLFASLHTLSRKGRIAAPHR